MNIVFARLAIVPLAILPALGIWLAATTRNRLGWNSVPAKAAWLTIILPLGVGTAFLQIWLYSQIAEDDAMHSLFVAAVVVTEEAVAIAIGFYYLWKFGSR